MEAVERIRPAEQERHFDGQLRLWRDRYRAEGLAEGLARERRLLVRQAARKFGALDAAELANLLNGVDDAARLEEMGEWLIDCETGAAFVERVSRGGNGRV